jgi:ferritin-like metal-binding protein YciE
VTIKNMDAMFLHELGDIYDAEHQFLAGQEKMRDNATDAELRKMISQHITETKQQIKNLEQVFELLGEEPKREPCAGARGLVTEASKLLTETASADEIRDYAIAGSASKVEQYEILSYEGLISAAREMGHTEAVKLFKENLEQEEKTSKLLEESEPALLEKALKASGEQKSKSGGGKK